MVYADSAASYDAAHLALRGLCDRIGITGFFAYFEKIWHASQERWVMYLRADLPHFRNHTNNRLERFFVKLKDGVDGSMSMAHAPTASIPPTRALISSSSTLRDDGYVANACSDTGWLCTYRPCFTSSSFLDRFHCTTNRNGQFVWRICCRGLLPSLRDFLFFHPREQMYVRWYGS
ncbi:hypothetical protein PF005_g8789 [Phytophthora fragariae]|uniref:Uncharacterized protein n=1 Tax=Phytophthora fragariae TaxID=53985 RepID=A0A6A3YEP7_9STRA|nr:hypothetical protein PF005_g8789 [Phytophthora fragariae]KAE9240286.1 hypothetical protein PF002_g9837 [Phytophthora fragariae]